MYRLGEVSGPTTETSDHGNRYPGRRKEEAIEIWFMSKSHSKSKRPPSATFTPHTFPDLEEKSERLSQEEIQGNKQMNVLI